MNRVEDVFAGQAVKVHVALVVGTLEFGRVRLGVLLNDLHQREFRVSPAAAKKGKVRTHHVDLGENHQLLTRDVVLLDRGTDDAFRVTVRVLFESSVSPPPLTSPARRSPNQDQRTTLAVLHGETPSVTNSIHPLLFVHSLPRVDSQVPSALEVRQALLLVQDPIGPARVTVRHGTQDDLYQTRLRRG